MVSDFSKEKVHWTKDMNLALAKYMADKPNIWDMKHPQFSNTGLRDEMFAKFAQRYEGLNWQATKERWTNIRSTYGFYMRKIQARRAKGQEFKVNWFMWQPCKYLYKVYKTAEKKQSDTVKEQSNESDNENDTSQQYENCNVTYEDSEDEYLAPLKRPKATCDEVISNLLTVFKNKEDNQLTIDESQYAQVGEAVTNKLSQLNSYEAARLSQKILEILAEYDENNPMNPNNSGIGI